MIITVIGLMFGDEGKGHTVAELTKRCGASAIVRFSGGSQAAHRVVRDGKSHIFAQLGSGSAMSDSVKTYLSKQMVVDPLNLFEELRVHKENGLGDLIDRLFIDPECPVVTPYHKALNRAREIDREVTSVGRLSSTGLGIGEVFNDIQEGNVILRCVDFLDKSLLKEKVKLIFSDKLEASRVFCSVARDRFLEELSFVYDTVNTHLEAYLEHVQMVVSHLENCITYSFYDLLAEEMVGTVILEGSQGTLLDVEVGTKPFITKSKVTLSEADRFLAQFEGSNRFNLGVIRGYVTRHGLGPLPNESECLTKLLPDPNNCFDEWQRDFRVGWLDLSFLQYALKCNPGLSGVVITNLDRLPDQSFYADVSGILRKVSRVNISKIVKEHLPIPVSGTSSGEENQWRWKDYDWTS